jgi:quercetin dioxygenase-like cupin family protein
MPTQATELTPHAAPDAIVLGPGEGEAVWFLETVITVKIRSADGVSFGVSENRLPAGSSTPFHRHDAEDEALYVLEGELTLYLDGGRTRRAGPGA